MALQLTRIGAGSGAKSLACRPDRVQTRTMTDVAQFDVGEARLTRVAYFDIGLDLAVAKLTPELVQSAIEWAVPTWVTPGQVLVGQVLWVIESQGTVIVVDPCGASDAFLRTGPEAIGHQEAMLAAMAAAGFPPERVDVVVLTHLDGIGMAAVVDADGSWHPAFPKARIVMTQLELDYLASTPDEVSGLDALNELIAQGAVDGVEGDHRFSDEVAFRFTGGHTPGHAVVEVVSGDERAVLIGHLSISPVIVVADQVVATHDDDVAGQAALRGEVDAAAEHGSLVIGPLWPYPGAARVTSTDPYRLEPATS